MSTHSITQSFPGEPAHLVDLIFGSIWGVCGGVSFAAMFCLVPLGIERMIPARRRTSRLLKWIFICSIYIALLIPLVWWWTKAAGAELREKQTHLTHCRIEAISIVNDTIVIDWETGVTDSGWRYRAQVR